METCYLLKKKAIHYYYLAFYNNNSSHKLEMEKGGLWVEEIESVFFWVGGGGMWVDEKVGWVLFNRMKK
jgi:predicted small integral membrane protein